MKKALIGIVGVIAALGGAVLLSASRYEAKTRPNSFVGPVPVGGLVREEAEKRLRIWWFGEKTEELTLVSEVFGGKNLRRKASALVALDDKASIDQIPFNDFWDSAKGLFDGDGPEKETFAPVFREVQGQKSLVQTVDSLVQNRKPARVMWVGGGIQRIPETPTVTVDEAELPKAIVDGLMGDGTVQVPMKSAEKHVPDAVLNQISEVVSEFSTKFPQSNRPRNTNIKAASDKINGVVLMPGDKFSFNKVVGKRTIDNGFREAGVYANGRHDTGVGGGICQVSTTLYNAALFANLKISRRNNHSMPVAYVPIGRDATVNYGSIDLEFVNDTESPIAITSTMEPGRLTYRILGKKDPGLEVKIVSEGHKTWDAGQKTVVQKNLAPGKKVVLEKGSRGHSVTTYRLVYRNGKLEAKQPLGRSYYRGGTRIIAVGPAASPASAEGIEEPVPDEAPIEPDESI